MQSNWPTVDSPGAERCTSRAAEGSRRVAAALIVDALESVANPTYLPRVYPSQSPRRLAQMREKDLRWILSNRTRCPLRLYSFVSFIECCDMLGLDPDLLRTGFARRGWLDGTGTFKPLLAHRLLDAATEAAANG